MTARIADRIDLDQVEETPWAVACDWPFARITSGRVVVETVDGPEAYYEWEAGR